MLKRLDIEDGRLIVSLTGEPDQEAARDHVLLAKRVMRAANERLDRWLAKEAKDHGDDLDARQIEDHWYQFIDLATDADFGL